MTDDKRSKRHRTVEDEEKKERKREKKETREDKKSRKHSKEKSDKGQWGLYLLFFNLCLTLVDRTVKVIREKKKSRNEIVKMNVWSHKERQDTK